MKKLNIKDLLNSIAIQIDSIDSPVYTTTEQTAENQQG